MVLTVLDLGDTFTAFGNLVYSADRVRAILFYQVDKCVENFDDLAQKLVEGVGRGDLAVFFTAADVSRIYVARGRLADIYATIGLANPACLRARGPVARLILPWRLKLAYPAEASWICLGRLLRQRRPLSRRLASVGVASLRWAPPATQYWPWRQRGRATTRGLPQSWGQRWPN